MLKAEKTKWHIKARITRSKTAYERLTISLWVIHLKEEHQCLGILEWIIYILIYIYINISNIYHISHPKFNIWFFQLINKILYVGKISDFKLSRHFTNTICLSYTVYKTKIF